VSRILVSGVAPLPWENTRRSYAPGLRTWQFAAGLARAGHRVQLIAVKTSDAYGLGEGAVEEEREGIVIRRVGDAGRAESLVRRSLAAFVPHAVVGANLTGSSVLARCRPRVPFWADQNGHAMTEAQARAAREGRNCALPAIWRLVVPVMTWADRISVVSPRQRHAAIGELGALGRLTAETCGYEFTAVVPIAVHVPDDEAAGRRPSWRGRCVPEDAFVVIWSGSFNTWCDVETLFAGLQAAMRVNPRIHFVSTGGDIPGHDVRTYAAFERLVASSDLAPRFHLEGWIEAAQARQIASEADLGILTEKAIYEGWLGTKNRVVQWMAAGLPVACTVAGDLEETIASEELALGFAPGEPRQLAERVLWAAEHREAIGKMARRARARFARMSIEETTAELARWADAPTVAPDAKTKGHIASPFDHEHRLTRAGRTAAALLPGAARLALARACRRLRAAAAEEARDGRS
jgi:glycosyltransferase involved in cell wall biosynthesis